MPEAANDNARKTTALAAVTLGKPCPVCGTLSTPATRPFCSARCADIDLHRWLGGAYAVPVASGGDEDDEPGRPSLG